MDIEPLDDRVVIKPDEAETVRDSGLVLPANAQEVPQEGEVLAKGDNVLKLDVGDRVLYSRYGGQEIERDGTKYLVARESDVIGRVKAA